MKLFRVHAYAVVPQKDATQATRPQGGTISPIGAALRSSIEGNLEGARFDSRTLVDFDVDTTTRTNEVRDWILAYGFGAPGEAKAAALSLAGRLSSSMDHRSASCLFIPAAFRDRSRRQVALWIFPQDEAFRLQRGTGGPTIEILTDVFSQTSRLRKAASFTGRKHQSQFLQGRVLDFQANQTAKSVADFWITRFLLCRFSMTGDAGTRLLARTVRQAHQDCEDPDGQEQLYTGVMAIRRSPQKRISLQDFADRYLTRDGPAYQAFMNAVPAEDALVSLFDFQTDVFDDVLQFRVFQLRTGVVVSSPLKEVGESVRITEGQEKELSCRGAIVGERLRSRHA